MSPRRAKAAPPPPPRPAVTPAVLGPSGSWHVPPWSVADFYYGVWGDDTGRVWAVGQVWAGRKGIALSEDFGRSWAPVDRPNQHQLNAIHGATDGDVWAVGSAGTVLRAARDTGVWKRVRAGLDGELTAVFCRDAEEVYVGDARGAVYRTSDAGRSWVLAHQGTTRIQAIGGRPGGAIHVAGNAFSALCSDDGVTFREIQPTGLAPAESRHDGFHAVAVGPDGAAYLGGSDGLALRSRDAGERWEELALPLERSDVKGLSINDAGTILLARLNTILRSDDGGASWTPEHINPDPTRHKWNYALWLGARGDAVAVGAHGTIRVRQR